MAAYAVAERVRGGPVHALPHESAPPAARRWEQPLDAVPPGAQPELDDPDADDVADRLAGLREQVVISLFSRFDPDSWR